MLISLRELLDHAADNSYGMPAFNVKAHITTMIVDDF
jgi:fructose/tagatose bisphosphate aldolase